MPDSTEPVDPLMHNSPVLPARLPVCPAVPLVETSPVCPDTVTPPCGVGTVNVIRGWPM